MSSKVLALMITSQTGIHSYHVATGSLRNMLGCSPKFDFSQEGLKNTTRQIVKGLANIHANGVVHLDIKPDNLLYFADLTVKICDFGCAHQLRNGAEHLKGTRGTYANMSPEVLKMQEVDTKVWALLHKIFHHSLGLSYFIGNYQHPNLSRRVASGICMIENICFRVAKKPRTS